MIRKWIVIFLGFFFPNLLNGNAFFEDLDPALFHYVNVVTGDLNLTFEDVSIRGVVPYTVLRTYCSNGFSPYHDEVSDRKKELRESPWIFRGGWTLLAHGNLLLEVTKEKTSIRDGDGFRPFYYHSVLPSIIEKNGSTLEYSNQKWLSNGKVESSPSELSFKKTPHLNPRRNPLNNRLILEETRATLFRSDGSEWHYSGDSVEEMSLYASY